jgi:hypothetical protein
VGSIPTIPVKIYGDCGEVVNTADCGSAIRGFDSHQSPLVLNFCQVFYGDCGEVVNTADCGSATRGFDSHQSPLLINFGVSPSGKATDFDSVMRWFESSYPSFSLVEKICIIIWRYSQVVRQRSAKPSSPVQIRLPPCKIILCRRGGIGRRAGLKIQCPRGRAGSTPAAGILRTPT